MGRILSQLLATLKGPLFRSAAVYLGSSFLNRLVPFLVMPVLTRCLTPDDYGIVAMFTVLLSFVSPLAGLSIHGAIYRKYFDLDRDEMKIYVTNALGILLLSSCIVGLVLFIFSGPISTLTAIPPKWFWAVISISVMSFFIQILLSLWQVQVKPISYGIFQNLYTVTNVAFIIFFVLILGLSWRGSIAGSLFASIIFGLAALLLLHRQKWLRFSFNLDYIKNALNFGVPMLPTALKGSIMTVIDRLFITNMIGLATTGLYAVGFQLSMAIGLLTASFNNAYVPWLFEKLKRNNDDINRKIVMYTYLYFVLIIVIALMWALVSIWLLGFFVGPKFYGARIYVVWLSLGFAFSGMHSMVVNYIYYTQKTAMYGFISIISIGVNIGLNYFLISRHGGIGAAQATCITFLLVFLLTWWLAAKVHPMPWLLSWKRANVR